MLTSQSNTSKRKDRLIPPDVERLGGKRRILLVDEHQMTRECLAHTLEARALDFQVDTVGRASEAAATEPEVILLDIQSCGNTEEKIRSDLAELRRRYGRAGIMIMLDLNDPSVLTAAMRSSVQGYVPTSLPVEVAIAAIRLVLAGGVFVLPELIGAYAGPARPEPASAASAFEGDPSEPAPDVLTVREKQVLTRLKYGMPNKVIAHELSIAPSTVKVHVHNIMKKLNARNRTQVVFLAGTNEAEQVKLPAASLDRIASNDASADAAWATSSFTGLTN